MIALSNSKNDLDPLKLVNLDGSLKGSKVPHISLDGECFNLQNKRALSFAPPSCRKGIARLDGLGDPATGFSAMAAWTAVMTGLTVISQPAAEVFLKYSFYTAIGALYAASAALTIAAVGVSGYFAYNLWSNRGKENTGQVLKGERPH